MDTLTNLSCRNNSWLRFRKSGSYSYTASSIVENLQTVSKYNRKFSAISAREKLFFASAEMAE